MELLSFENTERVLEEYAEQVRESYVKNILEGGHNNTGRLIESVKTNVNHFGNTFEVELKLNNYYKYLEEGIAPDGKWKNPGWKAYPYILNWVKTKFKLPEPENGKLRVPKGIPSPYLVTRKIVNEGIEPKNLLSDAVEDVNREWEKKIIEALDKDLIGAYDYIFQNW